MRKYLHTTIVALSGALIATVTPVRAQTSDWPTFLFDQGHSSYNSAATAITPANASTLVEDWTFVDPQPTMQGQPAASIYTTPAVVNGVVYVGSNTGTFYALDETTGAVLWQQLIGFTTPITCGSGHGITSSPTLANDPATGKLVIYVGGGDGYLYALDASNGDIIFRQFVTDVGTTQNLGFIWGTPTVVNSKIYLGWASACDNPLVRSGMKSFDQHTGMLQKTFWTLPKGSTGAGVWSTAATNGKSIWFTTGNGAAGGYSYAVVKLNAMNLRVQSAWINPAGTDDLDWGSSPSLFTVKIGGVRTTLVGASGKDGIFHVLDANHLENGPIWSYNIGTTADFATGTCLAAPIWNANTRTLFVASNLTTINGQSFPGAIRAFDPTDGSIIWERGVTGGPVMGSPTLDGAGVLAAATYNISNTALNAAYLLNAADGTILKTIPEPSYIIFGQPVFSGNHLFIAGAAPKSSLGKLTAFIPSALKSANK